MIFLNGTNQPQKAPPKKFNQLDVIPLLALFNPISI